MPPLTRDAYIRKILLPGDVLLFNRKGFFNWVIRRASNRDESHSEVYIGGGITVASRNGKGVSTYDLDTQGLSKILRPKALQLDWATALKWHASVDGSRYDWPGLWRAFVLNRYDTAPDAFWCSEHTTEFMEKLGVPLFPPDVPASSITPGDIAQSLALTPVKF